MLDNASITALVSEHGKWLMGFLRGLTGSVTDAEDAFQETWMRLYKMRAELNAAPSKAYLVKTARSVVVDRLRRARGKVESLDAENEDGDRLIDDVADERAVNPSARCESTATAEKVRAAVASLPFNLRQVVLMRIEGDMEFKAIAAELGVPLGTTLTWMRKATQMLKVKLGGENGRG